uniref:PH01B035L11.24 protein n=1 Tax=Phyllostachys edulis TaxID=38705 RepID=L0P1Q7_PHYED|nr:PH01B035L11.24 [Phyllostachys edulis]
MDPLGSWMLLAPPGPAATHQSRRSVAGLLPLGSGLRTGLQPHGSSRTQQWVKRPGQWADGPPKVLGLAQHYLGPGHYCSPLSACHCSFAISRAQLFINVITVHSRKTVMTSMTKLRKTPNNTKY